MAEWRDSEEKPAIYHCISRVVERRYVFGDGAVIGSKEFVNEAFAGARERFSEKRQDGARRMRGNGKAAEGTLWSARDLRVGVD